MNQTLSLKTLEASFRSTWAGIDTAECFSLARLMLIVTNRIAQNCSRVLDSAAAAGIRSKSEHHTMFVIENCGHRFR
jgi:hypothetical protein